MFNGYKRLEMSGITLIFDATKEVGFKGNDGREAFLDEFYYDRTCLGSADGFTSVWHQKFLFLLFWLFFEKF